MRRYLYEKESMWKHILKTYCFEGNVWLWLSEVPSEKG